MVFPQETGVALAHTLAYVCDNAFTLMKTLGMTLVQLLTHALSHALWITATRQPLSEPPPGEVANFYDYAYTQDQIPPEYQVNVWWLALPAVGYYFWTGDSAAAAAS